MELRLQDYRDVGDGPYDAVSSIGMFEHVGLARLSEHFESLREHHALTLRRWVANLESAWDAAVREVGRARARIWRLYLAGSALAFEAARTQVHQVLATKTVDGASGMPLRPAF